MSGFTGNVAPNNLITNGKGYFIFNNAIDIPELIYSITKSGIIRTGLLNIVANEEFENSFVEQLIAYEDTYNESLASFWGDDISNQVLEYLQYDGEVAIYEVCSISSVSYLESDRIR